MTSAPLSVAANLFASRRQKLMESLSDGAIILTAGHDAPRNNDVDYEFRQQSAFWYLTGFDEPDVVAVLRPGHSDPYVLFVRPYDPRFEIWVGYRAGVEGAMKLYGADAAYSIEDIEAELAGLLEDVEVVYYALGDDQKMDRMVTDLVSSRRRGAQRAGNVLLGIHDPKPTIDQMRLIKSADEVDALQRAIAVTARGFDAAMRYTRAGVYEYQVQAELESIFRKQGSPRNGYPSIVASGGNSCTLHYISNRAQMRDGDLLLIDAGAEADYYTADITRTWPVNGKFTPVQREVYAVVLEAQHRAFAVISPEASFEDVHRAALRVLVQGLVDLSVLQGDIDGLIEQRAYQPYYMHGTSHWLGLDVHDAGPYRVDDESIGLKPGMVFTVEPGLYFGPLATESPPELKGIGIRIEDNVLVTANGYQNLSAAIPSQPDQIEALVGRGTD